MIISTTLSGNAESQIADALRSVLALADICLLIDTGITDRSLEKAREVAGDKLVVEKFTWSGDFSEARNFALRAAGRLVPEGEKNAWALTLDTDERLVTDDAKAALAELADFPFQVGLVFHKDRSYAKERLIRLPLAKEAGWVGPTHEAFLPGEGAVRETLRLWHFDELSKTPEAYRAKFRRDAEALTRHTKKFPKDGRWWFYLGESLWALGEHDKSGKAYQNCFQVSGWDEERGWAAYRVAVYYGEYVKDHRRALDWCTRGLAVHPGFAELAWYAGWNCLQLQNPKGAVFWSRAAKAIAEAERNEQKLQRIGFRHQAAYEGGPDNVETYAWQALGGR